MHSCCGEEYCGVILRNKGGTADLLVALGHEEVYVLLPQFIGCNLFHIISL